MATIQVELARLGLCSCGYTMLNDGIPKGTPYLLDTDRWVDAELTCGGCGQKRELIMVWADKSKWGDAGYIPAELFDLEEKGIYAPDPS